jgi:hypothetical protein
MQAIVLTCDRYHTVTDHMIHQYMALWPDNPFTFRVPYQVFPHALSEKYRSKVGLIQTDPNIKSTLLGLIAGIPDEEWIYWCMDDRYPIRMNVAEVAAIHDWVGSCPITTLSGVMFSSFPKMMQVKNIMPERHCIRDASGRKYYRRKTYAMIWMHQFLRAGVLRALFARFPDDISQAKQMDHFKKNWALPAKYKLYMNAKGIATYGESTHRGRMTKNCADSFKNLGMDIPPSFEVMDEPILIEGKKGLLMDLKYRAGAWVARLRA